MSPPTLISLALATSLLGVALGAVAGRAMTRRGEAPPGVDTNWGLDAFDTALMLLEGAGARLVGGGDGLAACARALGALEPTPDGVIDALSSLDPDFARRLEALRSAGEPFAFEALGPGGAVSVQGRSSGALAWLKASSLARGASAIPTAASLAAFIDARSQPAWITDFNGALIWANRAWLAAVGSQGLEYARNEHLSLDRDLPNFARDVARARNSAHCVRWIVLGGRRRALRIDAHPLENGRVALWADDITDAEESAGRLHSQRTAHEQTLNHIADALVVFGPDQRLIFHNAAFAELWDLEPAWLADRPRHAELLDRLRQRRRLPETMDYARFKTDELARYEELAASPEVIWRLPDERTLRVIGQPHPLGGVLLLFSDITPELRLKTQFNHLIQVQQATLDKLTDAVAVFGADSRLKLHNEAFERFWAVTGAQLAEAPDFDGVVELCLRRLHDQRFWRELKGRITDPDPSARAPVQGELVTADRRIVTHQSRPLPDGATLISFADVTDTRRLEGALADREAALSEAERLKRAFVGSVSYELRTPLTTIIGYAELLDRAVIDLSPRARAHVAAVRSAAGQLARSVNQVLDMAEIDAGEMTLEIEDVDVMALMSSAADRWSEEARVGGVAIKVGGDGTLRLIRGDGRRLSEVVDHMMENALRYAPADSAIQLSAEQGPGEVRLRVADRGVGIPFHVQAHIFDRFSGAGQGGAGLGLALVKALVELHGGWVTLESEPGAGATFTCHLPEMAEAPEGRPELF